MSYYIDKIIAGVQDYLGTKGLTINPASLDNPEFYYMFGEDPANWNLGPHLISTDGSDVMLNPTYLALNSNNWSNPSATMEANIPEGSLTLPDNINYYPPNIEDGTFTLSYNPDILEFKNNGNSIDDSIVSLITSLTGTRISNTILRSFIKQMPSNLLKKEKVDTEENSTETNTQNQSDEPSENKQSSTQTIKLNTNENDVTNNEPATNSSPNSLELHDSSEVTTKSHEHEKTTEHPTNETGSTSDPVELNDSRNDTTDTSETEQKTEKQPIQTNTDNTDKEKQNEHSDETTNSHENKIIESDETEEKDGKDSVKTNTTQPTLTLQLSNLNNKIKNLNELQQQTVLESEQKQVGEKTSENTEEDLTKKEEITRAVQNFDKGISDIESGFNLLITDENGNPSPLYYIVENGVYYRLDDETKQPIDTTKSQFKLTENEYKSYLSELNNKENEAMAESETLSLPTENLTTEPLPDTQQTGTDERKVYTPQTQQVAVSTVSTQPQSNPQQLSGVQQQVSTPEQQAQLHASTPEQQVQQQAQLQALKQAEQQKKEDEKANFLVKSGRWIQENVFDTVGNAIPIPFLGTGIKMIGNVFTGLLKTIGHIFDGNWKKMASDGWSWLKDTAIVGGTTFGIYKLGKSLDWWGKDKSKNSSSGTNIGDLSDEQVASMAEKVITGKSGVFSSSTKPLTTLVNAQNNIAENNGVSDALRKTASIAAQAESTADIIQQNTKTME